MGNSEMFLTTFAKRWSVLFCCCYLWKPHGPQAPACSWLECSWWIYTHMSYMLPRFFTLELGNGILVYTGVSPRKQQASTSSQYRLPKGKHWNPSNQHRQGHQLTWVWRASNISWQAGEQCEEILRDTELSSVFVIQLSAVCQSTNIPYSPKFWLCYFPLFTSWVALLYKTLYRKNLGKEEHRGFCPYARASGAVMLNLIL